MAVTEAQGRSEHGGGIQEGVIEARPAKLPKLGSRQGSSAHAHVPAYAAGYLGTSGECWAVLHAPNTHLTWDAGLIGQLPCPSPCPSPESRLVLITSAILIRVYSFWMGLHAQDLNTTLEYSTHHYRRSARSNLPDRGLSKRVYNVKTSQPNAQPLLTCARKTPTTSADLDTTPVTKYKMSRSKVPQTPAELQLRVGGVV